MKRNLLILTLAISLLSSGCIPLIAGAAVYGVVKSGQNSTERRKAYDQYVFRQQEINMQREKEGLAPIDMLSYPEWKETLK